MSFLWQSSAEDEDNDTNRPAGIPSKGGGPVTPTGRCITNATTSDSFSTTAARTTSPPPSSIPKTWDEALRQSCVRRNVIFVSARTVLSDHPHETLTLPFASETTDGRHHRDAILNAMQETTTTTANEKAKTTTKSFSSSIDSGAMLLSTITSPVKTTARLLLSPLKYVANQLVGHDEDFDDYTDDYYGNNNDAFVNDDDCDSVRDSIVGHRLETNNGPEKDDRQRQPLVALDQELLCMDLCLDCIHLLQAIVEASPPTIFTDLQSWVRQQLHQQQVESSAINTNDTMNSGSIKATTTLLHGLPSKQLYLLASCCVKQHLARNGDLHLVGHDPHRTHEVRVTLYRLDQSIERVTQTIETSTRQVDTAHETAQRLHRQNQTQTTTPGPQPLLTPALKLALQKRRLYQQFCDSSQGQLLNLIRTRETVEAAASQGTVVAALQDASVCLKSLRLDDRHHAAEETMDNLREELKEIDSVRDALGSTNMTLAFDEDALLDELNAIEDAELNESVSANESNDRKQAPVSSIPQRKNDSILREFDNLNIGDSKDLPESRFEHPRPLRALEGQAQPNKISIPE